MELLLIDSPSVKWSPSSRVLVPLLTLRYHMRYLPDMVSVCVTQSCCNYLPKVVITITITFEANLKIIITIT